MNPSLLIIPDRYKASKLYSQLPESGAGDFTVVRGTTATRVNASGLIESVASGVPRIDYTGGGCGKLLVEPAATNLVLRSEEFDNASWAKINSATVTENSIISPDGTLTADTIIGGGGSVTSRIQQSIAFVSGTTFTYSIYLKANTSLAGQIATVAAGGVVRAAAQVNNAGGVLTISGISAGTTARIKSCKDEWYRVSITFAASGESVASFFPDRNGTNLSWYAWGAQVELGSVATSYIPTVAATVTRNADVISVSSASGLIGQTEGTLYAEVDLRANVRDTTAGNGILDVLKSPRNNAITIFKGTTANSLLAGFRVNSVNTLINIGPYVNGRNKIAFAYQSGNSVCYVNGVLAASNSLAFTFSTTLDAVTLGTYSTNVLNDRISAAALYTTRLSDPELIALTTL